MTQHSVEGHVFFNSKGSALVKSHCGVMRGAQSFASAPRDVDCDRCSLKITFLIREYGDFSRISTYTWADIREMYLKWKAQTDD